MTTTTATISKGNKASIDLVIGVVLALAGIAVWVYQINQGLQATGLDQQIVWGLYIAAFFTAIGAGAALLVLSGAAEFTKITNQANRKRYLLLALACFVAGGLLIAIDLGSPLRTLVILTAFRFSSMMTWDFWLLILAGLVALVFLLTFKNDAVRKVMGAIGILAGAAVVIAEGWMLSRLAAHPMWTSPFTIVTFLVGAAIAGVSLALFVDFTNEKVKGWLKILLGVSLTLVVIEVLTSLMGGSREAKYYLTGFAAPAFWWQVILGLVVPFILLTQNKSLWLAGLLALSGVVAEKVWMLSAGQATPWLELPAGVYAPTWLEYVAVIGMASLGYLVYRLLLVIFKPEPTEQVIA